MSKNNDVLNDYFLIKFLVENYKHISFLSKATTEYIHKIENIFKKHPEDLKDKGLKRIFNKSRTDAIDVLNFWERLLIDAIKYLKWHDLTEFTLEQYNEPRNPSDTDKKEEAYDKISEGSLQVYYLKDYFKEFVGFESILYGAEELYREHVYHMIRVWLIGQYILKEKINEGFPIEIVEDELELTTYTKGDLTSESMFKSNKNSGTLYFGEEDAIWCLISLTHDLGYPLSKIEEINASLKKMLHYFAKTGLEEFSFSFPQQNQFINDAIVEYISSIIKKIEENKYETHIQAKYYLKISRSFELFRHGLISCIVLVKNLIYFLETNFDHDPNIALDIEDARQFVIRREILRAIASHTCPEIYHVKPNTFSFLLLLADEIQFWGRPTFEYMLSNIDKKCEVILTDFNVNNVSFEINCNKEDGFKEDSLIVFFLAKAAAFKKILRVAVKSVDRQFTFNFTVNDETGTKYQFIAKPRERPIMIINGEKIDHIPLQKLAAIHKNGKEKFAEIIKLIEDYKVFE